MRIRQCCLLLGLLTACTDPSDLGSDSGTDPLAAPCANQVNTIELSGPEDVTFGLDLLTGPGGRVLTDGPMPRGQVESPNPMGPAQGVANAMVPSS